MRIIKFKGKCIVPASGFRTVCGSLITKPNGRAMILEHEKGKLFNGYGVDPNTICQFTGLLDKNGKEIYEGDVVRSDTYPFSSIQYGEIDNYYGAIYWSCKDVSFNIMCIKNIKSSSDRIMSDGYSYFISKDSSQDFEVIGNIHDDEWKQYRKCFQEAYKE